MDAFWGATVFVVLAEMGDKTQLLAMAMAARFRAGQVLLGVAIATMLNHGLAVLLGDYLGISLPTFWVQLVASVSFVAFGFWTLRGDTLAGEDQRTSRYGPVVTVAIAFFLAEMGDKTQLATIALAARYSNPAATWLGTNLGMLIADSIGIFFGSIMHKHIDETKIRIAAATVFLLFGLAGSFLLLVPSGSSGILTAVSLTLVTVALFLISLRKLTTCRPPV